MEHSGEFKYLGLEVKERKNSNQLKPEQKNYIILNLLDCKNAPCKFFIFNSSLIEKLLLLSSDLENFQSITVFYEIVFNNSWNVRLVDVNA